ncbi:TPA: MoaD/ThiS family protein [archaeon]|nr:MoaD/ThiS family protein [Candidatus Undinarchaeales archaeon SRR5007147.bin71]
MKIKIVRKEGEKRIELPEGATASDIFGKLGESSETYIIKRAKEVIIGEEPLSDGDELELIKIISGG